MSEVIQCAINISTSDPLVLEQVVEGAGSVPGLVVADSSLDRDHNRSVVSLLGAGNALAQAVITVFAVAERSIDMTRHSGEHPRIGSVDVIPFVPWINATMETCIELAGRVAEEVADRFGVPVYLYGEAARRSENRDLSFLRRGGFEQLQIEIGSVQERFPDYGPRDTHPTLGAVAIGARGPLIAFNVNLKTNSRKIASDIARKVRGDTGGLSCVKAIGVKLANRGMVQVSMNLLDFRKSTLYQAYELIKIEARRYGIEVAGSEIIGLVPLEALVDLAGYSLGMPDLRIDQVLEYHLIS